MSNVSETVREPRLPSMRTLLAVGFCSMLVVGVADWLTEPHDLVKHRFEVVEGDLVKRSTSARPNPLRVRLRLTAINGVVGGVLTVLLTWCGFRMRLSWWRIQYGTVSPDEPVRDAEGDSRPTTH
jgi:hypothetical protein